MVHTDGDGVEDRYDLDSDGDELPDSFEGMDDVDRDGRPNAYDRDSDDDLVPDSADNCPYRANPDQSDRNGDRIGDACESLYPGCVAARPGPAPFFYWMGLLAVLMRRRRPE